VGIAAFASPIKATSVVDNLSRLIVGWVSPAADGDQWFLTIDGDGRFHIESEHMLVVDLRYDPKTQLWTDPTEEGVPDD